MATEATLRCGELRTSYKTDATIFPNTASRNLTLVGIALLCCAPLLVNNYYLNLLIQIGYYGIAALGLNILVGFTGQISLGHSAFFGFGAFASAYLNNRFGVPVLLAIPLAGILTTAVGLIVGIPAGRIKGLYLAIATLASQFILEDFFSRADWFTGGASGAMAAPVSLFGFVLYGEQKFFYFTLFAVVVMYLFGTNLLRTRDGRAFVAIRDHALSAEIMGINLTRYRILSFGISSFYAGIGGALFGHYLGFVSAEGFTLMLSVQFLAMIIIGGLGSVRGTLFGTAFMVLLPEGMEMVVKFAGSGLPGLSLGLAHIKEMSIGLAIILFLIYEPEGLANRWRKMTGYWRHYPFSH